MKSILFSLFLLLCFQLSQAQYNCSFIPIDDPSFVNSNPKNLSSTGGLIKLYFHVYNDSDGNNGYPADEVIDIVNRLNTDFAQTNFTFFHNDCETEVLDNDGFYSSNNECDFFARSGMCNDGVNIHVKGDNNSSVAVANGAPGSQILIGGIKYGAHFPTSSVISHEMGHVFGLLHTFHGFCYMSGVDCNGTTVEIHCDPDGDGIDDTPLDRNTWPNGVDEVTCEWNGLSSCLCDETIVTSPTDNFMAYTRPSCMSIFTGGQKAKMYSSVNYNFIHDVPSYNNPTAFYKIVDSDGVESDEFCRGDKVNLDACYSSKETKYSIAIWEYEIGGYANGEDNTGFSRTDPSWIPTKAPCGISLNDIWANFENEFRAGYEYRVQLAVQNECSTGWFAKDDGMFTIHHPTPDYEYVDENGLAKNEFCMEEIVYLDGSASFDENKYWIGLWKYNLGGYANGEDPLAYSRTDPKWQYGEVGEQINLNEIWGNFQLDYFEPGFEYKVQLVVRGECDPGGWNVKEDEVFTVICCDDYVACADFEVSTEGDIAGNIEFSFDNKDYSYYAHRWTVYQHGSEGEGPYEVIAESNDPEFIFTGVIGVCYTIMHVVETPCGSCCFSMEVCQEGSEQSTNVVGCDFINCNNIVPTGLSCTVLPSGNIFFDWDDIEGATHYIVRMRKDDPQCCEGGIPGTIFGRIAEESEIELEWFISSSCFSWEVIAVCETSNGHASERFCYSPDYGCGETDEEEEEEDKDDDTKAKSLIADSNTKSTSFEVYPNPSNGEINFEVTLQPNERIENVSLIGVDGKVIDNITYKYQNERVEGKYSFQSAESGIFFLRVQSNDNVFMKKIMLIQ